MIYLIFIVLLFLSELAYFKIADKYNIIDKPNHRSSHRAITIRGGGIIFPIAAIIWFFYSGFQYPLFIAGLVIISIVSFMDDVKEFPKRWRLTAHIMAMLLVVLQLKLLTLSWPLIAAIFIFFTGVINAYNFMDGINGITGVYSLCCLVTFIYVNNYKLYFADNVLLWVMVIAVMVFNFFNFRTKAKCFAGDVGSIAIAFVICFLLIKLILQTTDMRYILLLCVYGIDAVVTIILRLINGENIFLAHRKHLYQLLVNECKFRHLTVSAIYATIQLVINAIVINTTVINPCQIVICMLGPLILIYVLLRASIKYQLSKTKAI